MPLANGVWREMEKIGKIAKTTSICWNPIDGMNERRIQWPLSLCVFLPGTVKGRVRSFGINRIENVTYIIATLQQDSPLSPIKNF